jgi:hypothetical protein
VEWAQQSSQANLAMLATFGQPVTYRQGAGDPFQVAGILQKETDEQQLQDGVYASMFVLLADFPSGPDPGDELAVDGTSYTVYEVSVDLTGAVRLRLRQNS